MLFIATLVSSLENFTVVIALALFLRSRHKKQEALFIFIVGMSWIIPYLLKPLFAASCPATTTHLYCYPSGHVFDYVSLYGALLFLHPKNIWQTIFILPIVLVGISRLSVGAHYLSQVVGGYILGFAWLLFLKSRLNVKPQ